MAVEFVAEPKALSFDGGKVVLVNKLDELAGGAGFGALARARGAVSAVVADAVSASSAVPSVGTASGEFAGFFFTSD